MPDTKPKNFTHANITSKKPKINHCPLFLFNN